MWYVNFFQAMSSRAIRGFIIIPIQAPTSPEALAVRSEEFLSFSDTNGSNSVPNNRNITSLSRRFILRKLDVVAACPRHSPKVICKSGLVATVAGIDAISPDISKAVVAGLRLRLVIANQLTTVVDDPLLGLQVLRREQTSLTMCWMVRIGYGSNSNQSGGWDATRSNLGLIRGNQPIQPIFQIGIDPRIGQIKDGHILGVIWPPVRWLLC